MSSKGFLTDRIPYLGVYVLNLVLITVVIQLDLWQTGRGIAWHNIVYMGFLSLLVLGLFLFWDYCRHRTFYRQLQALSGGSLNSLDETVNIEGAVSIEQSFFVSVLQEQYRLYMGELVSYRDGQKLREHFVQRWVHQMKTPLSVVSLMLQEPPEVDVPRFWQSLKDEMDKLAMGISMVLHQSRLESFTLDLSVRQVDAVSSLRKVLNDLKSSFIRSQVYPRLEYSQSEVFIHTDEKWLFFVLQQLLSNALKYSRLDDGRSRQLLLQFYREPGAWCLRIQDEGVGIVKHDLGRIFQAFFTGENGRRFPEATGMGLYLVAEICGRLGHGIAVESEPSQGTAFTLRFFDGNTLHSSSA